MNYIGFVLRSAKKQYFPQIQGIVQGGFRKEAKNCQLGRLLTKG
jgi:hypothetical protein